MVREVTRRNAPNVSGRTNINAAAPSVQARPTNRIIAAPSQNSASQLADSLRAISPGLNKFLQVRQNQYVQDEMLKGQQAAELSKDEIDEKIAKGELRPEQSPWFQQAYMKQAGINAGQRKARQLIASYEDPSVFNKDTGDIDEFIGNQLHADIKGLEDSDFKTGFLQAVRGTEEKLRNDFTNTHIQRVREDARNQVYESYFNAFTNMGAAGNFDPQNLDVLASNAQALNLERGELNAIAFQAASTYALEGEGHPEVFELFKNKGKNGVASLYYTKDYGKQLQTIERQAASLSAANKARLNNQIKFNAEQEWTERLQSSGGVVNAKQLAADIFDPETNPEGRLTYSQASKILKQSKSLVDGRTADSKKAVYEGYWRRAMNGEDISEEVWQNDSITTGQAEKLEKIYIDKQQEIQTNELARSYLSSGRGDLKFMFDDKTLNSVSQDMFDEALQKTGNYSDAAMSTLDEMKASGVMPPQLKSLLTTASPNNEMTWNEAINVYRALSTQAPAYLNQTFTDSDQIARFDAFTSMTEQGGATPKQAMEAIGSMSSEDIRIGGDSYSDPRMISRMHDKINSEFDDMADFGRVKRDVTKYIKSRLSMPDHPEFNDDLIESAISRVRDRQVKIAGAWVDRAAPGANIEGLDDAADEYLTEYFQTQRPELAVEATRMVPDQHTSADGSWAVLDANGYRLGRIDPKRFVTDYRIKEGDLLTKNEMERQGIQARYVAVRDELDEIDDAQFGLTRFSEQGKDDPRYKANAKERQKKVRQLKELQSQLSKFNKTSPVNLNDSELDELEALLQQR